MSTPRFAIGIDLGTSNCALATVDLADPTAVSAVFDIPQAAGPASHSTNTTLPSCLYLPPEGADWIPGLWARDMAFVQPGRVAHSAKSWLCHPAVDRDGRLLPWQSEDIPPGQRLSPVDASARLLRHLRESWESAHGLSFADQCVVVTVPASFDAAAEQLTLEAALRAGYPANTLLMEEPQAAFYRWLERGESGDLQTSTLLVVDIGGGTTDFSLFEVGAGDPPIIRRRAVGDHLLLGGDNLDRTLAEHFRRDFEAAGPALGARQWAVLLAESRRLKEALLSPGASVPSELVLPAAGSGLFAGTRAAAVDAEALRAELLEGFFPEVDRGDRPLKTRAGLREIALPYAADSAVTRHLAAFLDGQPPVDFLLCNGGTLAPARLRERLLEQIARWQECAPVGLENLEPDLAVARGAAVYAARRQRKHGLMESGAAHSVYLEIADRKTRQTHQLCILPRGTPAETPQRIENHPLRVLVNTAVRFQAGSSPRRPQDQAGDLLSLDPEELHALPPMQTRMELPPNSPKPANNLIDVAVEARLTEAGLLKVVLVGRDRAWKGKGIWELAFNLRSVADEPLPIAAPEPALAEALDALRAVFGKKSSDDPRAARHLPSRLETCLRKARGDWSPALCRALWPELAAGLTRRQRSKDHEAAWLSLAGYLLRPGFGVDLDSQRINELWRLQELGLAFPREARNRTQLWILWRRVAGGLDRERQRLLAETWLGPLLSPGAAALELIRLAGSLERVPAKTKSLWLRNWTLRLPKAPRDEAAAISWSLGRLLSRIPFGGGPEDILSAAEVETLLEALENGSGIDGSLPEMRQALLRAARLTGMPGLDVSEGLRLHLCQRLSALGVSDDELRVLREVVAVEENDRAQLFGETLPPGLLLGR